MPLESPETDEQTKLAIVDENHKRSAHEIMIAYREAMDMASQAKDDAQGAIEAAQRCGAMLNAKKAEIEKANKGPGIWLIWLETYLPEIQRTTRTLQRWMQLSQRASQCDALENAKPKSLRQAYIAVGIFPDPLAGQQKRLSTQSKPLKSTNRTANLRTIITEFRAQKPIEALIQIQDFSSWDEVELKTISRLLEPLTLVRNRLVEALFKRLNCGPSNGN